MSLTLVIGGTRSGKSAHAERLAAATGLPVRYVATADGGDPAMADRIRAHVARRPPDWSTVEPGTALAGGLADAGRSCVLIDGLGPWIAAALDRGGAFEDDGAAALATVRSQLLREVDAIAAASGAGGTDVIVVAEEAGQGMLPPDAGSRAWLDVLGDAVQRLAAAAERVELVVAGRALRLGTAIAAPSPATAGDRAVPGAQPVGADLAALRRHGDADVRPGDADHAVNVLSGGPPAWLRDELADALAADVAAYPREDEAVAALAALHGRSPAEVVPANGAAHALWMLPAALRPRHAAVVHPGFTEAEAALHAHLVPVTRVLRNPARDFALDPDAVPRDADLVIVGNPASPSGTLDPAAAVLALRRPGRVVVVEEAFMDLVPGEPGSVARDPLDDVIVVRSLTKSLAIPGLRAGYALAPLPLAERLRAVRPPWAVNALALAALTAVAGRPQALAEAAARADRERRDLARRIDAIAGVRSWPAAANYLLVEVGDGPRVVAGLRKRGIAVRPALSFPGLGAGHLRLTARGPRENARLADALAEAVAA
jgi:histidinol-phosphate/aromatic aminotransferase/cobyric acid decarboxylase-like protein/adenosyl cobinamide kinase/adenosyl cobinamide phosphate guanylyltransferase